MCADLGKPVNQLPAGEKHSLWLMPTGDVCNRLSRVLHQLSARYGAPEFSPHVTLLGGCVGPRRELIRQSARVASALQPFTIRLEEIDFRDEYFRCLFVHAALTAPLRKAHQAARQAFGRGREPAFMPHLSLLYGNFPRSLKEAVIAQMGPRLDVQFKVRSLHLYRTRGYPHHWRRIESFGLE
jgi:2'-5' RNA ligase